MRAAQRGGDGVAVRVDETIRVLEPGDGPFRFSVGMTREIGLTGPGGLEDSCAARSVLIEAVAQTTAESGEWPPPEHQWRI